MAVTGGCPALVEQAAGPTLSTDYFSRTPLCQNDGGRQTSAASGTGKDVDGMAVGEDLGLDETGGCACGWPIESLPEARCTGDPPRDPTCVHQGALGSLRSGEAMVLVAPHDPIPLLQQMRQVSRHLRRAVPHARARSSGCSSAAARSAPRTHTRSRVTASRWRSPSLTRPSVVTSVVQMVESPRRLRRSAWVSQSELTTYLI